MRMRRTSAVAVLLLFGVLAPPAFAQGAYVGAFLVGEIVRLDQYDSRAEDSGNGESFGFALRLGSPIGAKWGVELEFVRPGEITSEQSPEILPAADDHAHVSGPSRPARLPASDVYDPLIFPAYLVPIPLDAAAHDAVHLAVGAAGDLVALLAGVSRRRGLRPHQQRGRDHLY